MRRVSLRLLSAKGLARMMGMADTGKVRAELKNELHRRGLSWAQVTAMDFASQRDILTGRPDLH